jgi:hypothetical protein
MTGDQSGVDAALAAAVESAGEAYLDAERQLVALGEPALASLEQHAESDPPFSALVAKVARERIKGDQTLGAIGAYLDEVEQATAKTPMMVPPPTGVRNYLAKQFGDRAAPVLAVYLAKLGQVWPRWKTLAALFYLGDVRSPDALPGLVRFLASTQDERFRELAVASIRSTAVAAGADRLLAVLQEMESAGGDLLAAAQQVRETLAPLV